jgi:Undecaprenyl-phosphate glucose phosphotransferase
MLDNILRRNDVMAVDRAVKKWRMHTDHLTLVVDVLRVWDIAVIFIFAYIWKVLYAAQYAPDFWASYGRNVLAAAAVAPFVFQLAKCYRADRLSDAAGSMRSTLIGCGALIILLLVIGFATRSLEDLSRGWAGLWMGSVTVAMVGSRLMLGATLRQWRVSGRLRETVAIVGTCDWAHELADHLACQRDQRVEILGVFDDRRGPERASAANARPLSELLELAKTTRIDKVIVALPWSHEARLVRIFHKLKALAVDVTLCPDRLAIDLLQRPLSRLGDVPLVRIADRPLTKWSWVAKQIEDKLLAGMMLLLLGPGMLLIALAIMLDSPGPVLFRQRRDGFNGCAFEVLKFRSMRVEAADHAGARQTSKNDDRVTRLGAFLRRTSLDELPQLFNVMRGDMSLVGPRPHPIGMRTENKLCHEIIEEYAHRFRVKPGITGWAQVNGQRGATHTPEQLRRRVEYDLAYVENWSIALDLRIIAATAFKVFTTENAY